jgi:hypothetical protein
MAKQFASCPCCGMTVPLAAMNFDEQGKRVLEPVQYATLVKLKDFAPISHKIQWSAAPMPAYMLVGLAVQLETALAHVRAQLQNST